jgi:hypothetical protein
MIDTHQHADIAETSAARCCAFHLQEFCVNEQIGILRMTGLNYTACLFPEQDISLPIHLGPKKAGNVIIAGSYVFKA